MPTYQDLPVRCVSAPTHVLQGEEVPPFASGFRILLSLAA